MVGALLSRPEDSGDGDPAVQTRSLSRRFAAIDAVSDLTLRVERGQIFGFLGPNGAGKTTTIKMLCGLLEPTSGSARVAGCDIRTERDRIKRATGYMAQTFSLYPDLTSEENFRFFGGVYGIQGKEADHRLDEVFTQLGIDEIRRAEAGTLSGGWKQRLALACALVHSPRLLFLDEPTAGVDPSQRQRMWDFLYELCEGGTSLFVTTRWSVVLAAQEKSSPDSAAALETLCRAYWYPLCAYVRSSGHAPHDAHDLTQEFFARLLAKDYLQAADREKGRCRTFLRVRLKRFLANEWDRQRAAKRGGGARPPSTSPPPRRRPRPRALPR